MKIEETADVIDDISDKDFNNVAIIEKPRLSAVKEVTKELIVAIEGVPKDAPIYERFRLPNVTIELRPIDKDAWHGKTGVDNFDRGSTIECAVLKSQYQTGLTPNERLFLEDATGFDLSSNFNPNRDHPFYGTLIGRVKLENRTLIFDLSIPLDFIKYKLCLANPMVANSLEEYNTGVSPLATHYIHDETKSEETEIRLMSYVKEAQKLHETLTPKEQRIVLTALTSSDCSNLTEEGVDARLTSYRLANVHKFLETVKQPKDVLQVKAILILGISKNVLDVSEGSFSYNGITLGHDVDSAAKMLINPENQSIRIQISEHVRNK